MAGFCWCELGSDGLNWHGLAWVCLKWRWPDGVNWSELGWAGPAQTINVSKKLRMNLFILEEKTKKYDYII
jgi:hypothetical protein